MIFHVVLIFCALSFEGLGSVARGYNNEKSTKEVSNKRFARQIVPGTKWCGNGDKASNDSDLGRIWDTDTCCREHDKCPMLIHGHETKYGLTNPDLTTRCHCDCDRKFFDCLVETTSGLSRTIGRIYFNLLRKQCFRKKECPLGEICETEYEWVEGSKWLPSEEELKRLYRNMGLIIPELEFD